MKSAIFLSSFELDSKFAKKKGDRPLFFYFSFKSGLKIRMDILTRKIKNTRKIKKRLKRGQAPFSESDEISNTQTSFKCRE